MRRTTLVLPVDGAPLAFSTGYAHDLSLNVTGKDGKTIELPATADALQAATWSIPRLWVGDSVTAFEASLQGYWGFEPYEGPSFHLINARTAGNSPPAMRPR